MFSPTKPILSSRASVQFIAVPYVVPLRNYSRYVSYLCTCSRSPADRRGLVVVYLVCLVGGVLVRHDTNEPYCAV